MGFLAKWLWLLFLSEATGYGFWFWLANAILVGGFLLLVLSIPFILLYLYIKDKLETKRKIKRGYAVDYDLREDIEGWYLDSNRDRITFKNNAEEPLQIKFHNKFVNSVSLDECRELQDNFWYEKPEVRLKPTKQNKAK